MSLKKFTGNYISVIDALSYPANFYQAQKSIAVYSDEIKRDIKRTMYLSYTSTVAQMQQRLSATEHLEGKTHAYAQGNFDGGVFYSLATKNAMEIMYQHTERLKEEQQNLIQQRKSASAPEERLALDERINALDEQIDEAPQPFSQQLRISYTSDNNELMALCVYYIRDDSNLDIPLADRPLNTAVAIIHNPHFAPEERQVTYFAPDALLDKKAIALGQDISDHEFEAELEQALGSTHLKQLLTNMFNGTQISLEHFNDLSRRLGTDRNIDHRDEKQKQLEHFFQFVAHNLSTDLALQTDVEQIKLRVHNETDFFQKQQFENELDKLYKRIEQAIDDIEKHRQTNLKTLNKLNLWATQLQAQAIELKKVYDNKTHAFPDEKPRAQAANLITLKRFYQFIADNLSTDLTLAANLEKIQLPAPNVSGVEDKRFIDVVDALYESIDQAINDTDRSRQPALRAINKLNLRSAKLKIAETISSNKPSNYIVSLIREAFSAKAQELDRQIASDALEAQSNQPLNELIDDIFLTVELQRKQTIEERANTQAQRIPLAEKPQFDTHNFFSRNWPSLGLTTATTLLGIGLFLAASGLFIAFTGLALIATIGGAASASALALGVGIKIVIDEVKRKKQFDSATTLYNNYTSRLNDLTIGKNAQLATLEVELQEHKQNINKMIVEVKQPEEIHASANDAEADDEHLLSLIEQTLDAGEQHVIKGSGITVELPQEEGIAHLSAAREVEQKVPEYSNNQPKI